MNKGQWQVQAQRDGQQVQTFILPELLGLTTPESAISVAREILGGTLHGTVMDSDYNVFLFEPEE